MWARESHSHHLLVHVAEDQYWVTALGLWNEDLSTIFINTKLKRSTLFDNYLTSYHSDNSICKTTNINDLRQWPTWSTLALFYNTFIINPLHVSSIICSSSGVELYWCSIWYRHSQSVSVRCTGWVLFQPVHRTATGWEWRYLMLHQYNSISWWWAYNARNM